MRRLLLDSHSFLWFVEDDARLPPWIKHLLEGEGVALYLSVASAFEIAIKHGLGKLPLDVPLATLLGKTLVENEIVLLAINPPHLIAYGAMPFPRNGHRDPFDRLLVAQSMVESMPLVSRDAALDAYGVQRLWSPQSALPPLP